VAVRSREFGTRGEAGYPSLTRNTWPASRPKLASA